MTTASPDPDCVFCGIAADAVPSSRVYEDDEVVAFVDIDPVTPGHLLVIPREHLPDLADLSEPVATKIFGVARQLAAALRRTDLRCDGVNLFYADGAAAFQEVFHAHLHVFPRYDGDGFTIDARWGSNPDRTELDTVAAKVAAALDGE